MASMLAARTDRTVLPAQARVPVKTTRRRWFLVFCAAALYLGPEGLAAEAPGGKEGAELVFTGSDRLELGRKPFAVAYNPRLDQYLAVVDDEDHEAGSRILVQRYRYDGPAPENMTKRSILTRVDTKDPLPIVTAFASERREYLVVVESTAYRLDEKAAKIATYSLDFPDFEPTSVAYSPIDDEWAVAGVVEATGSVILMLKGNGRPHRQFDLSPLTEPVSLSYNSLDGTYLVTWPDNSDPDRGKVRGTILPPAPKEAAEATTIFTARPGETVPEAQAAYADVSDHWLVIWSQSEEDGRNVVQSRLFRPDGSVGPVERLGGNQDWSATRPTVAYNPARTRYLVVWERLLEVSDGSDEVFPGQIDGRWIGKGGQPRGESFVIEAPESYNGGLTSKDLEGNDRRSQIACSEHEPRCVLLWTRTNWLIWRLMTGVRGS